MLPCPGVQRPFPATLTLSHTPWPECVCAVVLQDYTDEMVVGGSQRNLAAADKIASSSTPLSLSEQAPVTFGDVVEASKVLSAPGDKVSNALLVNKRSTLSTTSLATSEKVTEFQSESH